MPSLRTLTRAIKRYPLPILALAGLAAGGVAIWPAALPNSASDIWAATTILTGLPLVYKTFRGLLRGKLGADIVAMLAIIAAIAFDEGFAGTVIVIMQSGGEALEDYGLGRASAQLERLVARAPRTAVRMEGSGLTVVPVEEVAVGDVLLVRQGDLVPVDGESASSEAVVDESAITGEPLPKNKAAGETLLSGSVNVGAPFEMRATRLSKESQYSKIVAMVKEAQKGKPGIQRMADRYARWFTPIVVAVAFGGAYLTSDLRTILSVLVVATPCPLILATPIAVITGVNKAASFGVIVKSGAALEEIAKTKVVVFDKTGTLTYGVPVVDSVEALNGFTGPEVMKLAGTLEKYSTHPLAASLVQKAEEMGVVLGAPDSFSETPSRGVKGTVGGRSVVVGLRRFCEEASGRNFPTPAQIAGAEPSKSGTMFSYVSIDGVPAGMVRFTDQLRPGVPYMVGRLKDLGVMETLMLTGDNKGNASIVAAEAGVSNFEADLLPAGKVEQIRRLETRFGTTVMVGDGINDAPALAAATVGVAMGAKGAGISSESADMVLLVDDVTRVPEVIVTGRRMVKVASQGIEFGLGSSFVLMLVASFGFIEPAAGALMQEVIDVAVILNALRVR